MDNTKQMIGLRKQKLQKLNSMNIPAYPGKCNRTHKISSLLENEKEFVENPASVVIAGRLKQMRRMGKVGFGNVEDDSGRIQLYVSREVVGTDNYEIFKLFDLGDFVEIEGTPFYTKTGEYSVKAAKVRMLAKNMRPIPTVKEKEVDGKVVRFDEFADIELRFRKRYLDLLLNPDNKDNFIIRAKLISFIRSYLEEKEFLEVETPILQPLYGGANARPFITHHNTLDMQLYLRIATELYLKRLIIGGFEKVYEIGKNFRNEGMDRTHNPEFTAIELYQAYTDLDGMMELTENMISDAAKHLYGTTDLKFKDYTVSLETPFRRATMVELIEEYTGEDFSDFDRDKIVNFMKEKEIEVPENAGTGKLIEELFEIFVEENLIQPTFVTDYPLEISPLAKKKPGSDDIVERFELFITGNEYANAFTELNDPADQRQRLEAQAKLRESGDLEANVVDEDFLEAMEYGMPPTGGLGIGIDRLVMLFTNNTSIKEVLLFPQMKKDS